MSHRHWSINQPVVCWVVVLAFCLSISWRWISDDYSDIRFVRLEGAFQHIERISIEAVSRPVVQTGLISLDLKHLTERVNSLPWVNRVDVERIWPDTVILRLAEQKPYFRWGVGGLLNSEGERFNPADVGQFSELPVIYARDGEEASLYTVLKQMQVGLSDYGMQVVSLTVSDRKEWIVGLTGGVELKFGRRHPLEMYERFIRLLPLLGRESIDSIESFDMRYPTGFAVRLKRDAAIS